MYVCIYIYIYIYIYATLQHITCPAYPIHIQLSNMTALSYLLKIGGIKNAELMQISKEIWKFLLGQGITITAEYLPGNINFKADW